MVNLHIFLTGCAPRTAGYLTGLPDVAIASEHLK